VVGYLGGSGPAALSTSVHPAVRFINACAVSSPTPLFASYSDMVGARLGAEWNTRVELVETFGMFVTSINSPPLATGGHEHTVPARWSGAAHGVAAPCGVLHHAEAEARCGPGDVGDVSHVTIIAPGLGVRALLAQCHRKQH